MVSPSPAQLAVVRKIVAWYRDPNRAPYFYLAGYAGSGKTTLVRFVLESLNLMPNDSKERVLYAAVTAKAADVLRRKTGGDTSTVHRLVYTVRRGEGPPKFVKNHKSALKDAKLLVLDECSMVTDAIAADILSFNTPVLVLGDPGQLPPVEGVCPFLAREPDAFLHEIHRQANEHPIIRLATMARAGERIPFGQYGQGVQKIRRDWNAAPALLDFSHVQERQILCATHKIRHSTTAWLRKQRGFENPYPEVGEKIICARNNYDLNIFNGTQGTTTAVNPPYGNLMVMSFLTDEGVHIKDVAARQELFLDHYDNDVPRGEDFHKRNMVHLDWGDVMSGHKAQGSSWRGVLVLDDSTVFRADAKKWLYTMITRAEEELVLVAHD